jgi:hypothetical protein
MSSDPLEADHPFLIAFSMLDPIVAGLGGERAATQIVAERVSWRLGPETQRRIRDDGVYEFRFRVQRLPVVVGLVAVERFAERAQWRIGLRSQRPFKTLSAQERQTLAHWHNLLAELCVAMEEVEDVDTLTRL